MLENSNFYSFQLLGIVFGVFLIVSMFFLVKSKMVQEKHSIVWLFIGLLVLIFSVNRDLLDSLSKFIGIDYAPSTFFSILIGCVYLLLLNFSISTSNLKKKTKTLVQEIALLTLKVEELENKLTERDNK